MSKITDSFFGEMNMEHDQLTDTYLFDKKIKISAVDSSVVLSIESDEDTIGEKQLALFKTIEKDFSEIWKSLIDFLVVEKKYLTESTLKKDYKPASITLSKETDTDSWDLELINLKDEFTSILINFEGRLPTDFSVEE